MFWSTGNICATHWAFFQHYCEIRCGDIIVFIKPHEPNLTLVKRVIGIPGDRIHMRNGVVYVNGVAQNEPQTTRPTSNTPIPIATTSLLCLRRRRQEPQQSDETGSGERLAWGHTVLHFFDQTRRKHTLHPIRWDRSLTEGWNRTTCASRIG